MARRSARKFYVRRLSSKARGYYVKARRSGKSHVQAQSYVRKQF